MKHRHHIIPRHAGGSDDPSNIQRLTIEEHAEAHKILYETYGREEDRIAWLGLSSQIGKEEAVRLAASLGGRKGNKALSSWYSKIKGSTYEEIYGVERAEKLKSMRSKRFSGCSNPRFGTKHSAERNKKHSECLSGKNHFNYGKPAFTRGRKWMNDGTQSKMIPPSQISDLLTKGWSLGRL